MVGRKQIEDATQVDSRSEADIVKEVLGRGRAVLTGLVNLAGGHRLRERQLWIFHHDAANQRDEQDAEHGTDQHERRRFPVTGIGGERAQARPETEAFWDYRRRPYVREIEGWQREDRAGGYRLSNCAGGARDVFF